MELPLTNNLKPKAAAAYVKWSESRLAKSRIWGDGPAFSKLGRTVVYRKADLDGWLLANRRISTSDAGEFQRKETD